MCARSHNARTNKYIPDQHALLSLINRSTNYSDTFRTMLSLLPYKGTLSLCGPELVDHIERLSPGSHVDSPHITIIEKHELQKLGMDPLLQMDLSIPQISLQILSVGQVEEVEFLTVSWAHAQLYRRKLCLDPKAFYITLSGADRHDMSKDFTKTKGGYPAFLRIFRELPETAIDFLLADMFTTSWQQELCFEFLAKYPESYKALIRFADHNSDRPHLSTNAYVRALALNPALQEYALKRLRRLAPQAPCGPFQIQGMERLPSSLLFPWSHEAKKAVRDILSEFAVGTRVHVRYLSDVFTLPRFFSMPLPYRLAGTSTPRNEQDIDLLLNVGITKVLTLTEEEPLDPSWFKFKRVSHLFVPVPNYKAPTIAEMDYIFRLFTEDSDGFWLVHCGGGKGRAGTVMACLLAMHGSADGTPQMGASQVIGFLRKIRPGSIETTQQEDFIASWLSHRWKRAHSPRKVDEPFSILASEADSRIFPTGVTHENVNFLMLVGLPGSGKSYVAKAIALRRAGPTIIISQDDSGSRSACETQMGGKYKDGTLLILDRCNPDSVERKYWLSLLMSNSSTACLYFEYDMELCLQRTDARLNHPTIQAGCGQNAVKQMQTKMQNPKLSEGFGAVLTVSSQNAAKEAILLLGGPVTITKFPRTSHLINLGAMTADDLVKDDWKDNLKGKLVIEEKIDGANMGFSLDYEKNLLVQNRSHYVNHTSHAQFKPLKTWLEKKGETIVRLLDLDAMFPERFILYGEWVVAKHSIPYSSLPDYFLAFDFYDRKTKTFTSREYLSRILQGTGISQVPLIKSTDMISREEILAYMKKQSLYYDGLIEGVYVRFEDEKRTVTLDRGKIVRPDFLLGNEHWTKVETQLNGLRVVE
jgi:atypical dual specificity phosphatase